MSLRLVSLERNESLMTLYRWYLFVKMPIKPLIKPSVSPVTHLLNPVNHACIRTQADLVLDQIYFETSPNGTAWTILRTVSCDHDASDVKFLIYGGGNEFGNIEARMSEFCTDALVI